MSIYYAIRANGELTIIKASSYEERDKRVDSINDCIFVPDVIMVIPEKQAVRWRWKLEEGRKLVLDEEAEDLLY